MNALDPGQIELLALLGEELGEVQQVIGKILRHGLQSSNPLEENAPTNVELLQKELGDVAAAVMLLAANGDIDEEAVELAAVKKLVRVRRWLHQEGYFSLDTIELLEAAEHTEKEFTNDAT